MKWYMHVNDACQVLIVRCTMYKYAQTIKLYVKKHTDLWQKYFVQNIQNSERDLPRQCVKNKAVFIDEVMKNKAVIINEVMKNKAVIINEVEMLSGTYTE